MCGADVVVAVVEAGEAANAALVFSFLRMVSIFFTKYFPKSLAKVEACKFGGRPSPCD